MATATAQKPRLASLDQFRGYTVAGMFLVNYLGYFLYCPFVLKHHNTYCSYADTIMPEFFFAVGFAFRLSFGRRAMEQGLAKAYGHVVIRLLGLILVAVFITYQGSPGLRDRPFDWKTISSMSAMELIARPLKGTWFQTLTHIAVTSLWILPVIRLAPMWRIFYMIVSALIHFGLSDVFYFNWVNGVYVNGVPTEQTGIDGGPLGFLTWTIPTMIGTLACDVVMSPRSRGKMLSLLIGWGIALMALGWILSCGTRFFDVPKELIETEARRKTALNPVFFTQENVAQWKEATANGNWKSGLAEPPFVPPPHSHDPATTKKDKKGKEIVPKEGETEDNSAKYRKWNYWMMSQRSGTISYLTFGAGISLAVYALFYILADMIGLKIGIFRTLGTNALIAYILHDFTGDAVKKFVPKDAPPIAMWISFVVFFFVTWLFIRSLEKKKIYIKL